MGQNNVIDLRKGKQEPASHTRGLIVVSSMMLLFFIFLLLAANSDAPNPQTAGTDVPRTSPRVDAE
jgi:hypothetical protein